MLSACELAREEVQQWPNYLLAKFPKTVHVYHGMATARLILGWQNIKMFRAWLYISHQLDALIIIYS